MLPKEKVAPSHGTHQSDTHRPLEGARLVYLTESYLMQPGKAAPDPQPLTKVLHEIPSPCRGKQGADSKSVSANLV